MMHRKTAILVLVASVLAGGVIALAGCSTSTKTVTTTVTETQTRTETVTRTVTKRIKAKPKPLRPTALTFNGNGGKTLPPVTVHHDSTLYWTNDGGIFQIFTESGVPVNSQAGSGDTFLSAGTYTMQVNAMGNWTIKIVPG
jgi:hypothetical protein